MLSKGTELFTFEADFFKFKQKYINRKFDMELWQELMKEGHKLLKNYNSTEEIEGYCFEMFAAFVEFLHKRENGKYKKM